MAKRGEWRIKRIDGTPTATDLATLERLGEKKLSDEELGLLFRQRIRMGAKQCEEAAVFETYCTQLLSQLEEPVTIEAIDKVKVKTLDRYVHVMGVLPPSHYVTLYGYAYPFHPCVTEVLWDVYEQLSKLAATAHSKEDFDGLVLGYSR